MNINTNVITLSNHYGTVTLTPVTSYLPVSGISLEALPVINDCLFSIEDAEAIALITDNDHIQVSFPFLLVSGHLQQELGFLVYHQSASMACVCEVSIDSFQVSDGLSAERELTRLYELSSDKLAARYA